MFLSVRSHKVKEEHPGAIYFLLFLFLFILGSETGNKRGMLTPTEDYNSRDLNFLQPRAGE